MALAWPSSSSTLAPSSPPPILRREGNNLVTVAQSLAAHNRQAGAVINKIEDILGNILDALREQRTLTIPLRSCRSGSERRIRFPARSEAEVKRFTSVLQILHFSHEALISGIILTKRNIYYEDPDLFGEQRYVDLLVDDIAFTFGVSRDALNIVAASKGLIAGHIEIKTKQGPVLDCSQVDGILIPRVEMIHQIHMPEVEWILVIEKEATFRGLARSRYFTRSSAGNGILVTAKGYPDLATRQFLNLLHMAFPHVPMHGLVDFDPDGISIFRTYKHGSTGLAHEINVTVPLSWLGPKSCDILQHTPPSTAPFLGDQSGRPRSPVTHTSDIQVLPLTHSDRRKGGCLLQKLGDTENQDVTVVEMSRELQLMLMLNIKAEIQALNEYEDITEWLDNKLPFTSS
ncbi:DNA topoisomerase IV, alpha subunit [Xylariomycetidae sp. FL2044]|nr:DNA topoisomerase IV, alpha subunit [Xylariomycetidae sp. FL2044]